MEHTGRWTNQNQLRFEKRKFIRGSVRGVYTSFRILLSLLGLFALCDEHTLARRERQSKRSLSKTVEQMISMRYGEMVMRW